ncbi:MAG: PrsW family intramembrane metalloprotease [Myxococcota bacterium]
MKLPLQGPERRREKIGLVLLIVGNAVGGLLLLVMLGGAFFQKGACSAMCFGALFAFPAAAVYLTVPRLLDRYDPEPWYALIGCLLWGAIACAGFSLLGNETFKAIAVRSLGEAQADAATAVIAAPVVEEFFKGLGLFGVFYFLRREFDGIVDGIIYGTFIALGFAATENVLYYGRAAMDGMFGGVFIARGIFLPWGHPVYTAMTGIGFGLAREALSPTVRAFAAPLGFVFAVVLHAMWNGSATFAESMGVSFFLCSLLLWFVFVGAFVIMVIMLVRRRGRVIRAHLTDEVAMGNLSPAELELVCDAFGVTKARARHGRLGVEFVRAAARLALSKWHFARSQKTNTRTVSADFIVPLRNRLRELRHAYMQGQQPR